APKIPKAAATYLMPLYYRLKEIKISNINGEMRWFRLGGCEIATPLTIPLSPDIKPIAEALRDAVFMQFVEFGIFKDSADHRAKFARNRFVDLVGLCYPYFIPDESTVFKPGTAAEDKVFSAQSQIFITLCVVISGLFVWDDKLDNTASIICASHEQLNNVNQLIMHCILGPHKHAFYKKSESDGLQSDEEPVLSPALKNMFIAFGHQIRTCLKSVGLFRYSMTEGLYRTYEAFANYLEDVRNEVLGRKEDLEKSRLIGNIDFLRGHIYTAANMQNLIRQRSNASGATLVLVLGELFAHLTVSNRTGSRYHPHAIATNQISLFNDCVLKGDLRDGLWGNNIIISNALRSLAGDIDFQEFDFRLLCFMIDSYSILAPTDHYPKTPLRIITDKYGALPERIHTLLSEWQTDPLTPISESEHSLRCKSFWTALKDSYKGYAIPSVWPHLPHETLPLIFTRWCNYLAVSFHAAVDFKTAELSSFVDIVRRSRADCSSELDKKMQLSYRIYFGWMAGATAWTIGNKHRYFPGPDEATFTPYIHLAKGRG
ncbi:hypothetical protein EBR96_01675, partial [bacterium]|nr:hypothetical protein [bacterium]